MRLVATQRFHILKPFQSTHPLRGATRNLKKHEIIIEISIHAPLAGCDTLLLQNLQIFDYFNPRTPCGVRLLCASLCLNLVHFNPRTPCGVRHSDTLAPVLPRKFQSTHPLRGATGGGDGNAENTEISIHAPLAGCDARVCISSASA